MDDLVLAMGGADTAPPPAEVVLRPKKQAKVINKPKRNSTVSTIIFIINYYCKHREPQLKL